MSNQSGIAFTHCAFTAAAAEHGHGHDHTHAKRREVVVAGKRVKTVDIHAHCCVPKAMAANVEFGPERRRCLRSLASPMRWRRS